MPFIEWTCVAGIPTLLCAHIIICPLHQVTPLSSSSPSLSLGHVPEMISIWNVETSLQFSLCFMIVTSILSLVAILTFGDTQEHNKRGTGLVMGSQLIPLLYMTLLLSILPGSRQVVGWKSSTPCRQLLGIVGSTDMNKICSEFMHHISLVARIFHHLNFALLGGFSFVLSFWWMKLVSRCNHRKFNKRRTCVHDESRSGLVQNDLSECSTNLMRICWKVYLSMMIAQSAVCAFRSDNGSITILLGMHHVMLILVYDCRVPLTHQDGKDSKDYAYWQDAFTPGEWMVVSTLITSLVGEYLLEYSGILHFFKSAPLQIIPIHLVVAHAGLSGCLVGVSLCSIVSKWVRIFSAQSNILKDHVKRTMVSVASLLLVFVVTMGFIEVALNSQSISSDNYCESESTSCAPFTSFSFTISWRLIPFPIQWLLHFLLSKVDVPFFGDSTALFRVAELAYWCSILAVCLPIAQILSSWIAATGGSNAMKNINSTHQILNRESKSRKKRIVIARKYFHLVAIILFAPTTWLDPDMMSLSYAIAIALLIVIEMIRGWIGNIHSSNEQNKCDTKITKSPWTWNNFYMAFLDEKDVSAANGGLAATHIALIFGCAFPLWVNQWLPKENFSTTYPLLAMLPFLGLLTLGVGDSISAIIGVNFGRLHWSGGSSRTIEGSICMFLSMMCIVMVVYHRFSVFDFFEVGVPLLVITLIEASTSQIDNLYLPLAGSTVVLLWTLKLSLTPCTP